MSYKLIWIYDDFDGTQIWIGSKADFIGSKDLIGSRNIYEKDEIKCYSTLSYYWVDTCSPKPSGNFTNFHTPHFPHYFNRWLLLWILFFIYH